MENINNRESAMSPCSAVNEVESQSSAVGPGTTINSTDLLSIGVSTGVGALTLNAVDHDNSAETVTGVTGVTAGETGQGIHGQLDEDMESYSDGADETEQQNSTTTRKKRKAKDTSSAYVENHTERTKNAKLRGMSLIQAAEKFEKKFGGKVLVKVEYNSVGKKAFCYRHGKDFKFTTTKIITVDNVEATEETSDVEEEAASSAHDIPAPTVSPGPSVSTEALRQLVKDSVQSALATPGTSGTSDSGVFRSPEAPQRSVSRARRLSQPASCQRCQRNDSFVSGVPGTLIPAEWFHCSVSSCKGRAHNDCVGLPGVTQAQLQFPWYCLVHLGMGRPPVQDDSSDVGDVSELSRPSIDAAGSVDTGDVNVQRSSGRTGPARGRGGALHPENAGSIPGPTGSRPRGRPRGSTSRGARAK